MLSFAKKILLADIVISFFFVTTVFFGLSYLIQLVGEQDGFVTAKEMVEELKATPNQSAMLEMMERNTKYKNASLINENGKILFPPMDAQASPDMQGVGSIFTDEIPYFSLAFQANGNKYLLKLNAARSPLFTIMENYKYILFFVLLFLPATHILISQFIIHNFSKNISRIIQAISPYTEGETAFPSRVQLGKLRDPGLSKLVLALNSLTEQIHSQIEDLVRQTKESEEILESLIEGVIAIDLVGRVRFMNRSALKMLGTSRGEILEKSLGSLESDLAKKCSDSVMEVLKTSKSRVETVAIRNDAQLYLDLISAPLANQNGALIVLQDKTSEYKVVEMGKDFVANASHELRTPITIIRGFAETLQDLPKISQEMLKEITEKIVSTCIRLDKLVKSLLTLTDLENLSSKKMQTSDLLILIENCRRFLLEAHPDVHISLKTELTEAPIYAETDLVELAILNLLENAVKYSEKKANIQLFLKKESGKLVLNIQDEGIGISKEDLAHIFDRFYTVNKARSRKLGGAGLGLSIVKTIIEKHKGTISVDSDLGIGSTFTITFPYSKTLNV